MTDSSPRYIRRLAAFIAALFLFILVADIIWISKQRGLFLQQLREHTGEELKLIGEITAASLLRGDYDNAEKFIVNWGKQHSEVIELKATSSDGMVVGHYSLQKSSPDMLQITRVVQFAEKDILSLEIVEDTSPVKRYLQRLVIQHLATSFVFIVILTILLWYAMRKTAFIPMLKEIRVLNETLENRVKERTRELEKTNEALAKEITERNRAEEELRDAVTRATEAKARSEAILAAIGDGVSIQDRDFRILYQNQTHKELMGDHVSEYCYAAFEGKSKVCAGCPVARTFADEKIHTVERRTERSGKVLYLEITTSPLRDAGGNVVAGIEMARDITARKQAEQEKQSLQSKLVQSQKMESIGKLAGGVAHDFNNLLSSIIGYGELALMKTPDDYLVKEYIELILEAGEKAAALTRQLLAFSRKQVLEMKVVSINTVIENMLNMLGRIIGEDIALELNVKTPGKRILGDSGQLEQVLMNLVINARDAMPDGGRLTIETTDAEVDEKSAKDHEGVKDGHYVVLTVSDTGVGISKKVQKRIFEPFFTTKGLGKGTGLGLSTVYGIVKQHGGQIFVYSKPNKGTTFKIYLPVTTAQPEDETAPEKEPDMRLGTETILVVDDEPSICSLVMETLKPLGYKIIEASSAEEALQLGESAETRIDLLLSDMVMPGMNGGELADILLAKHPEMKVILMSGYTDNSLIKRSVLRSKVLFLQKPLSPANLMGKLREALDGDIQQ